MQTLFENLLSLKTMAEQAPSLTKRRLQYWLTLNLDGFRDRYAVKIGGKMYLDRDAVNAWLSAHGPEDKRAPEGRMRRGRLPRGPRFELVRN